MTICISDNNKAETGHEEEEGEIKLTELPYLEI